MQEYDKIVDMNVLYDAAIKCRKGVAWKESTQRFFATLLPNIYDLYKDLEEHKYKQKPFKEFYISERGKTRHIQAPSFRDRVLQKAICDEILLPKLEKYMIYDNSASRKGKGTDFTHKRLKNHLVKYYKENGAVGYVLLIDFSKFFDTISHEKFLEIIQEKIKDDDFTELIAELISPFSAGLGIGSEISQIAGMIYPSKIDNYCKIIKSCKYYGRYCDDIYIIHKDKKFLQDLLAEIIEICEELGLKINQKKTQIYKLNRGFRFLKIKYILTANGKVITRCNKKSIKREKDKIKSFKKKDIKSGKVLNQFKSCRGNIKRFSNYSQIKDLDNYFRKEYKLWQK